MIDVFKSKLILNLLQWNDFGVATWRPTQRHQIVDHCFWQDAFFAILLDSNFVTSLRQLLALLVYQYRHVGPDWRLMTQGIPQHLLFWRVGQMFFGAHNMSDVHGDVVHNVGNQEHRCAITAQQHEVFDCRVIKLHCPTHRVVHDGFSLGYTKAQYMTWPWPKFSVSRKAVIAV